MNGTTSAKLFLLAAAIIGTPSVFAADQRDVVFECPCSAEWVATGSGNAGELTLHFGVRNFRTAESGEVGLSLATALRLSRSVTGEASWREYSPALWLPVGPVGPEATLAGQTRTFTASRPRSERPVLIFLHERTAALPMGASRIESQRAWHRHEGLTLWPVPGDPASDRLQFVDLLTDTDGDGVGDVNERIAGTSHQDPAAMPGPSTIDVLALFDGRLYAAYDSDPYTRIHHLMTLTRARFADSSTNIQVRTVGIRHTQWNASGLSDQADTLMEAHGADMVVQFHAKVGRPGSPCPATTGGCAPIGSMANRGLWTPAWAAVAASAGADTVAHQLGHALGLAHSARQGEASGAFRWSRGYYVRGASGLSRPQGTIMTYGQRREFGDRFSSSRTRCYGQRCGVSIDAPDGADAAASLDLLRFQAAGLREPMPDTDADGFVDATDAWPEDPRRWSDLDGDGLAEAADPDDDGDGIPDGEDAFPFDPAEWEDADGDGIGDNVDQLVVDLAPFRDPALHGAVTAALRKPAGASVTDSELASLQDLNAGGRGIRNLTGLELATGLVSLDLHDNVVSDLTPLAGLTQLETLQLDGNDIHDLSPLAGLTALETLGLAHNNLSDIAPLPSLTSLGSLTVDHNRIQDLSPLANLSQLTMLTVSANAVTDLAPLAGLTELIHLEATDNAIADVSALSGMQFEVLRIGYNDLGSSNLRALQFGANATLDLTGLALDHLYGLPSLANVRELILRDNVISDILRLEELDGVRLLDLSANEVADISPLLDRNIWRGPHPTSEARLRLDGNPLDGAAIEEHIPTLRSWGLNVQLDDLPDTRHAVAVPDPALHRRIAETVAGGELRVDHAITGGRGTIWRLKTLRAAGAGISDLTGLEAASNLQYLFAGSNGLTDLAPLAELPDLKGLDLSGNDIVDITPLVENPSLGRGDWIVLDDNPLSEESLNVHIPGLLKRQVAVSFDGVRLGAAVAGDPVGFEVGGHFAAVLGQNVRIDTKVRDPALAYATVTDGRLNILPGASGGRAIVTVTGIDANNRNAAVTFSLTLRGPVFASAFPAAADPVREGFMRVINGSVARETLSIVAFDMAGTRRGPALLEVGAGQAVQFNSGDLEAGNRDKGLSTGVGPGDGDWRLALRGSLDAQVLSYIRTRDGFVTSMHDLAPMTDAGYRVVFFNPASNANQVSLLRLVNPGSATVGVTITGVDDTGASPGDPVTLSLDPHGSRTLSAQELETGEGVSGALGDGSGKWRLLVSTDDPILVASLLRSPNGQLANLSSVPDNRTSRDGETVHQVPLFLSASTAATREGFARVINGSPAQATVRIIARDDSGNERAAIILTVAADSVAHFNSNDLEIGSLAKGLSGGVGNGQGHWRLELASEAELDVLTYIRTEDGFVTSMHDMVPLSGQSHRVPVFNPGSNRAQVSLLRLVNPGTVDARVAITGVDDQGNRSGNVSTIVPAGRVVTLSARELESGEGVDGRLGDGSGKWRLTITSQRPVRVMSLLESPTGHLTNLSTGPRQRL